MTGISNALGGTGSPAGAAGTVYFTDNNIGLDQRPRLPSKTNKTTWGYSFRKLIIDNGNQNHNIVTVIMDPLFRYEFEMLVAKNHAVLQIHGDNAKLIAHKFEGDRTGLFHLRPSQTLFVEVVESMRGFTIAPISFRIDPGSIIEFPSKLVLLGTRTIFEGLVAGAETLIIAKGADVIVSPTTQTAMKENGTYIHVTYPGNISFADVTVQKGSRIEFTRINESLTFTANTLRIKYHGLVHMKHAVIESSYVTIESRGRLILDSAGFSSHSGPGAGPTFNGTGYGAGYGGEGGAQANSSGGGYAYGSLFKPLIPGSGGGFGKGIGGSGGGMIQLLVGKDILIDGLLSVRGGNATGNDAGGGSGGSVFIKCFNISGHGLIDVTGGHGVGDGGGGAGGRIGVHVAFRHKYGGRYRTVGGNGNTFGAAGTVYIEETNRGPQYADIKYDKGSNKTVFTATHHYVFVDNEDRIIPWSTILIDQSISYWEFEELHLIRHANLQAHHPDLSPNVTLVIHRFLGDGTGRVTVKRNQTIYVEVIESVTNVTKAPCSFKIDEGAEIVFPSEVHIYGTRSVINGRVTGVDDLFIADGGKVEFSSTSQTAKVENRQYVYITRKGNFTFGTITLKRNSQLIFKKVSNTLRLYSSLFRIKYEGKLFMNHGEFYSSFAWIESKGLLLLDGTGYPGAMGSGKGITLNSIGTGAGHGGEGGGKPELKVGQAYDSVYAPTQWGSGGGHGSGNGGAGGGHLYWVISRRLQVNGLISAKGLDGTGVNAGGGSGGSIYIKTTNMTGHGAINVVGGQGTGMGGSGAGGRIAIHCRWRYKYGGLFKNRGGQTNVSGVILGGAAGTAYKEENFRPLEYRIKKYIKKTNVTLLSVDHKYLHVDNEGFNVPGATVLMEEGTNVYEFDELELTGYSRLVVYHPQNQSVNVTVHKFIGDKTGQFHILKNQKIFVEVVESITNITEAPCSYLIEEMAEIIFPSEVHLYGTRTILKGMITGVADLFISYGAEVDIYSTTQTALMENRTYSYISNPGNISFAIVIIKRGGNLEFRKIVQDLLLTVNKLAIHYQGKLFMNHGTIYSTYGLLYSLGLLSIDRTGYPSETGPGAGATFVHQGVKMGTGAGHGGQGAHANDTSQGHGTSYDSVYKPRMWGSGGGNGSGLGGSGGGHLTWQVSQYLELNGILSAKGGNGAGLNAGGGSGGSILIFVTNMTGHGEINVAGGSGIDQGSGGSGGRVGIHCRWRYRFGGTFKNHGGQGGSAGAAAGTLYKEENYRELQYRIKKYMKDVNTTMLAVDHTMLFVSNEGYNVDVATVLMEEGRREYEFDEMELTGYSRLIVYHPNKTKISVKVHRFIGDKTGQFHVRSNQTIYVEYIESILNRTEAPCSYKIDFGGEIVLPYEFHVHGTRTELHGLMTGVYHLFIEDRSTMTISATATTAIIENRTYTDITVPGNASISNIIIKKGGKLFLTRKQDIIVGIQAELFEVKYSAQVKINHGVIYSTYGDIETSGIMGLIGAAVTDGISPGLTTSSGCGVGGGHGGYGGGSDNGTYGGMPYGSVFRPIDLGSSGGKSGGRGSVKVQTLSFRMYWL